MSKNVEYTGQFINDQAKLLSTVKPKLSGNGVIIHAHHITHTYQPKDGINSITPGKKRTIRIMGEVVTPEVHAVTVESASGDTISTKEYPHITIATAKGVEPVASNVAIAEAKTNGTIRLIQPPIEIETTEGYYDGEEVRYI